MWFGDLVRGEEGVFESEEEKVERLEAAMEAVKDKAEEMTRGNER